MRQALESRRQREGARRICALLFSVLCFPLGQYRISAGPSGQEYCPAGVFVPGGNQRRDSHASGISDEGLFFYRLFFPAALVLFVPGGLLPAWHRDGKRVVLSSCLPPQGSCRELDGKAFAADLSAASAGPVSFDSPSVLTRQI